MRFQLLVLPAILIASILTGAATASPEDDAKAVAALDTEYQAAVERNDAETMARILADDFVLVLGNGKSYNKADLIDSAKEKKRHLRTTKRD